MQFLIKVVRDTEVLVRNYPLVPDASNVTMVRITKGDIPHDMAEVKSSALFK